MILTLGAFAQLAAACGPTVHVDTLAAVARTESSFNTLAVGDNSAGRSYSPAGPQQAVVIATALLRQGHSIDLGLMQVNSKNLRGLGMSVAEAFDACKSLAAGARILVEGYRSPGVGVDPQPAIMRALSHYNTGNPVRGFANGYVRRVQVSAQQIVPAIRVGGTVQPVAIGPEGGSEREGPPPQPPAPPTWDVYGTARYRRDSPAETSSPPPAQVAPAAPPQAPPVQLQAIPPVALDVR